MSGPDAGLDLEILAAQLRRHTEDLSLYGGMLLAALSAALPAELVQVRREGRFAARLARREPAVLAVSITLGNHRYDLERSAVGTPPVATVRHTSGGAVLSSRTVGPAQWSRDLAGDLAAAAAGNAAAIEALARLTVGG